MKIGTKIYVLEHNSVVDCELFSATARTYSLMRLEDSSYIKVDKREITNQEKTRFFLSKIVALNVLEEKLELSLDRVREDIVKYKSKFFNKKITQKDIETEAFPYKASDIQRENKN